MIPIDHDNDTDIFMTSTRWSFDILAGAGNSSFRVLSTKIISWLFTRLSFKLLYIAPTLQCDLTWQSVYRRWQQGWLGIGVISILTEFISNCNRVQVRTSCNVTVRRWSGGWVVCYTAWYTSQCWQFIFMTLFCPVWTSIKEVNQPVV